MKVALSILLAGTVTLGAAAQENIGGDGILLHGKTVVLFAHVSTCASEGQIPAAQIFVSLNSGRTWQRRGPRLEGSAFAYVLDDGATFRVAGSHTAEGPELDPFLLVSAGDLSHWSVERIYSGPSELKSIALESNGDLTAWIKRIAVSKEQLEGSIWAYRSLDNGSTWRVAGRVPKDAVAPEGRIFSKIRTVDRDWRLLSMEDGGFEVQHRETNGGWRTVRKFPLEMCRSQ
jgi:hypothetical protein